MVVSGFIMSSPPTLAELIERHALRVVFQPIIDLHDCSVHGHESLVRGPEACSWATPEALFAQARVENLSIELEIECVRQAIASWTPARGTSRLFVNLSAPALITALRGPSRHLLTKTAREAGIAGSAIVFELTEHEQVRDIDALLEAARELRQANISVALDDFGDGRSSLRLWSELRPEIVKIDRYFTHGLAHKGDKLQTFRALLQIAETFDTRLVAEGIETEDELRILRDLGIRFGQGWLLGRPQDLPATAPTKSACTVLSGREVSVFPVLRRAVRNELTAGQLMINAPAIAPSITHDQVYEMLPSLSEVPALAIVEEGRPVGLLNLQQFVARYAKPYFREVYGKHSASLFANLSPHCVDVRTPIEALTSILTSEDQRYLTDGFVVTDSGQYAGLGTGERLVRAVTEARIEAARHANPLTFLPGNIPISDHIERLIDAGIDFVAVYADLNHFKPFNDYYGYWRGDEMIRLAAGTISSHIDPRRDFVGHVGGDDFVVLFQSSDWLERCQAIIRAFNDAAQRLYDTDARSQGGINVEDRYGQVRYHPFVTLALGVLPVRPGQFRRSEDVASAAATAKRLAKASPANLHVMDPEPRAAKNPNDPRGASPDGPTSLLH
jgi:diguanylate cyclase (GGDEF)-like protein